MPRSGWRIPFMGASARTALALSDSSGESVNRRRVSFHGLDGADGIRSRSVGGLPHAGNSSPIPAPTTQRPLLDKYCVNLSQRQAEDGGLSLQSADTREAFRKTPRFWEKVNPEDSRRKLCLLRDAASRTKATDGSASLLRWKCDATVKRAPASQSRTSALHR